MPHFDAEVTWAVKSSICLFEVECRPRDLESCDETGHRRVFILSRPQPQCLMQSQSFSRFQQDSSTTSRFVCRLLWQQHAKRGLRGKSKTYSLSVLISTIIIHTFLFCFRLQRKELRRKTSLTSFRTERGRGRPLGPGRPESRVEGSVGQSLKRI